MKSCLRAIGGGLLAGLVALAVPGHAAEIGEHTIKFPFVQQADNHWGAGAKRFVEIVETKSGGKIKIKLYPGGVLGGDIQTLSALQGGTVEMTMLGSGLLVGMVKEFALFDLPFLFNSAQETDSVLDGPVGRKLMDRLPEKGLVALGYWEHGFRSLTNSKRPIEKWEDIEGLKIRVIQAPLYIDAFSAFGANAVPMPLPELYTALETGAVDGQENPAASIESSKFYEVQKYFSTTRHVYNPIIVLFGKKMWDRLNADEQQILLDAAAEVKPYQRQVSRDLDAKTVGLLREQGMTVSEISDAERARMAEKLRPVREKYAAQADPALVAEMYAEIEKLRAGK